MTAVTGIALARHAQVVFANSDAYHVELPMVGREAQTEALLGALHDRDTPRQVSMHAPLGAGKTFFLNQVFGLRMRDGADGFDERRNVRTTFATAHPVPEFDDEPDESAEQFSADHPMVARYAAVHTAAFADVSGVHVLVIEELDRKATLGQVLWAIGGGQEWLKEGGNRVLVLTGDLTLRHERVADLLETVDDRTHLELDLLGAPLLRDALTARILAKVVAPSDPSSPTGAELNAASTAAEEVLADEYVRWASVPAAQVELATFREALGSLRRMSEMAEPHTDRVVFERPLVRSLMAGGEAPNGPAARLEAALTRLVAEHITAATPLPALSVDDLAAMIDAEASPRFREYVVDLLVQLRLLMPLGVPFTEQGRWGLAATVEPFVPSYTLVHNGLNELLGS